LLFQVRVEQRDEDNECGQTEDDVHVLSPTVTEAPAACATSHAPAPSDGDINTNNPNRSPRIPWPG
jgi:hypothetical protein